jgi:DNA-directed RNA polymerase subunit RPC12/RpoP
MVLRSRTRGLRKPLGGLPPSRKELQMRVFCIECGKSVSSELPAKTIVRAVCICPECIERKDAAQQSVRPTVEACPPDRHVYYTLMLSYIFCPYCGERLHSG